MKNTILTPALLRISKSLTRFVPAVAFFAFAASPQPAAAQRNRIEIHNNGADAIRACMYDARVVSADPMVCLKIGPLTSTVWDRKQATFKFHMKVFKDYGGVAALACERKDLSNATGFNINWPCSVVAWNATPIPAPKPTATPQPPPPERDPRVKIINQIGDMVKICVYKGPLSIVPEVCWTIKPKEQVFWDRKNDSSEVTVKFFKSGVVDGHFCRGSSSAHLKGIPELVTLNPGCLLTVSNRVQIKPTPVKPPIAPESKVIIRACNRDTDQTVNFVIAYLVDFDSQADPIVLVEGWFRSEPGKCQDIDMTPRFKQWRNPKWAGTGIKPNQFLLYAETGGILNKVWEGDGGDPEYCIKLKGNFKYKQGTLKKRQCLGANHDRVQMTPITNRDVNGNISTFYLNF